MLMPQVKDIFNSIIRCDTLSEDTELSFLCLDALDLVKLICDIEDHLRIQIPDEKAKAFKTVGQINEFVLDALNNQK